MIDVKIADAEVKKRLKELLRKSDDLRPPLKEIREDLIKSTIRRFETSTAPDGSRWGPNSRATMESLLHQRSSAYDKNGKRIGTKKGFFLGDGRVSTKSAGVLSSKKPLIDSGTLMDTIGGQIQGRDTLLIGSPQKYAAMQQFGGSKAEFKNLWGDIPARPFLGLSDADEAAILGVLASYLSASL